MGKPLYYYDWLHLTQNRLFLSKAALQRLGVRRVDLYYQISDTSPSWIKPLPNPEGTIRIGFSNRKTKTGGLITLSHTHPLYFFFSNGGYFSYRDDGKYIYRGTDIEAEGVKFFNATPPLKK